MSHASGREEAGRLGGDPDGVLQEARLALYRDDPEGALEILAFGSFFVAFSK